MKQFFFVVSVLMVFFNAAVFAAPVSDQRLRNAGAEPEEANWLSHGRSYREMRYSPLAKINDNNVDQLGLEWFFETETAGGLQATPIVVDGVMYFTAAWNVVYALDARTGSQLWKYDPQVPRAESFKFCCGVVSRGVAVWEDKVIVSGQR